ncbi:hypothetical protein A0H81_01352 [Grifola frondosa]|uniref:Uncharacterized protein n=1 Tax=Grifola frondosa TaxID=5627 RepID=A0A1C7MV22_GRIFR|nr:hypothetical protein A0H81_01352 [Grifola frondosa]
MPAPPSGIQKQHAWPRNENPNLSHPDQRAGDSRAEVWLLARSAAHGDLRGTLPEASSPATRARQLAVRANTNGAHPLPEASVASPRLHSCARGTWRILVAQHGARELCENVCQVSGTAWLPICMNSDHACTTLLACRRCSVHTLGAAIAKHSGSSHVARETDRRLTAAVHTIPRTPQSRTAVSARSDARLWFRLVPAPTSHSHAYNAAAPRRGAPRTAAAHARWRICIYRRVLHRFRAHRFGVQIASQVCTFNSILSCVGAPSVMPSADDNSWDAVLGGGAPGALGILETWGACRV